jgi:hypothetical protein
MAIKLNLNEGAGKRSPDRTAGIFDDDEREFVNAIERFKKINRIRFPSWTQVLWIVKQLGYEKKTRRGGAE